MRNMTKKILSLFLSALLLLPVFCLPASAETTCDCGQNPIVYVYGKHEIWKVDENGEYLRDADGNLINITDVDLDIGGLVSEFVPLFVKALAADDFTAYNEALLARMLPIYEGIAPEPDGTVSEETKKSGKNDDIPVIGSYAAGESHRYRPWDKNSNFFYDYRESPYDIADDLEAFVQQVKAATGHDKVDILTRCQGSVIVTTWLAKYQQEKEFADVGRIGILGSCTHGVAYVDALFSGHLNINANAAYRFLGSEVNLTDIISGEIGEFLELSLDMLKETYGIVPTVELINKAYTKLKDGLLAPWLRAFHAICGCNLALVGDHFDDAIEYLFPTAELKEEYAVLIEKAAYVHEYGIAGSDALLKDAQAKGVEIGVVAMYGFQCTPVSAQAVLIGDSFDITAHQSIGATTSEVEGTLPENYINTRIGEGKESYISPDKQIDASTCLFPDTTWFVKNSDHHYCENIHQPIVEWLNTGKTLSTGNSWPQFLNYTGGKSTSGNKDIVPAQEKNPQDMVWGNLSDVPQGAATRTFLQLVENFFMELINKILGFLQQVVQILKEFGAM